MRFFTGSGTSAFDHSEQIAPSQCDFKCYGVEYRLGFLPGDKLFEEHGDQETFEADVRSDELYQSTFGHDKVGT